MKNIYVILSQTGTALSRVIRAFTGDSLGHASLSFHDDFHIMYSFGRRRPNNPFLGGFVKESPDFGTFRRFKHTYSEIFAFEVSDETYYAMLAYVEGMYREREKYHYNYKGLFLAPLGIEHHARGSYYCSEFVGAMLKKFGVVEEDRFSGIIKPMDLYALPGAIPVYAGKLSAFRRKLTVWDLRDFVKEHNLKSQ